MLRAKRVAKHLAKIARTDSTPHVLLYNISAGAEDSNHVRKNMGKAKYEQVSLIHLCKLRSCSLVSS